jgi:hypothetical protein
MIIAVDDYTHPVGPESNFNESMYFEFHDPNQGISGFLRVANRPNEGRGERTVCLYLPDGSLGFSFDRPSVHANTAMAAAGLAVEVRRPLESLRITFDGEVHLIGNPKTMVEPKTALSTSPRVTCRIALEYDAMSLPYAETFDADGHSFAPHHYEQLAVVGGQVCAGTRTVSIGGHGLRDHSWGPRSWQAPWFYRWLHGSCDGFGFMVAYFGDPDGTSRRGGFIFNGGALHACSDIEISTDRGADGYPQAIEVRAQAGGRRWRLRGDALAAVPLRHRGNDQTPSTRIVETTMRWRTDAGTELHGMAEYLDQLRDAQPVGNHV